MYTGEEENESSASGNYRLSLALKRMWSDRSEMLRVWVEHLIWGKLTFPLVLRRAVDGSTVRKWMFSQQLVSKKMNSKCPVRP